jgi:hypothetical protein
MMTIPEDTAAQPEPAANVAVAPALLSSSSGSSLRLPSFWPESPASWFALAESRFRLHGVSSEDDQFDFLLAALPQSIQSIVETGPGLPQDPLSSTPYTDLKNCLLKSRELLTPYQCIERLFLIDPLGDKMPSELLAQMMEICPCGEEQSRFFVFLFLQRLPEELRILLGPDSDNVEADPKELAARADRLWAARKHHQSEALLKSKIHPTAIQSDIPVLIDKGKNLVISDGGDKLTCF